MGFRRRTVDHASSQLVSGQPQRVYVAFPHHGRSNTGFHATVAHKATLLAIERANERGGASVTVRITNYLASASHTAQRCAEVGVVGVISSNGARGMTLKATSGAAICAQALAPGVANAPGDNPIVLDMALNWVGQKVLIAAAKGNAIPDPCIVDQEGTSTTDPNNPLAGGTMRAMGGHKGSGLAVLVERLPGVRPVAGITCVGTTAQRGNFMQDWGQGHEHRSRHRRPRGGDIQGHPRVPRERETLHQRGEVRAAYARRWPELPAGRDRKRIAREKEQDARARGLELDGLVWNALAKLAANYGQTAEIEAAFE